MGYAPPYYLRLRIYARQVNYFYRKLRALPPVYDNCPVRCLSPEADKANGCPDCDFTIFYKKFKANYYRLLEKELRAAMIEGGIDEDKASLWAKEDIDSKWTFDNIAADYRSLSETERLAGTETEDTPGGVSPLWNDRIALAVAIIREERYHVRREVKYAEQEELDAKARAAAKASR